jgi:hypothetical protein
MLVTSALIIYILTLTLEIPKTRQFVYTALNTRFAAANLASNIVSGFIHAFDIYNPKYLNFYTVSIY